MPAAATADDASPEAEQHRPRKLPRVVRAPGRLQWASEHQSELVPKPPDPEVGPEAGATVLELADRQRSSRTKTGKTGNAGRGRPSGNAGTGPSRTTRRDSRGRDRDNTRPAGAPRPPSKPTGSPHGPPRATRTGRPAAPKQPTRLQPAAESLAPPKLPPGVSLPRRWTLEFEALDGAERGKVRISVAGARGEHRVFRPNPDLIWQAVFWARFTTAAAGVAAWSGRRTTMDLLTEADDPTEEKRRKVADGDELAKRKGRKVSYGADRAIRPDQAGPEMWGPNAPEPDGTLTWCSPSGRRFKKLPPGVAKGRAALGLPLSWAEHVAMNGEEVAVL